MEREREFLDLNLTMSRTRIVGHEINATVERKKIGHQLRLPIHSNFRFILSRYRGGGCCWGLNRGRWCDHRQYPRRVIA